MNRLDPSVYHVPVMLAECIDALQVQPNCWYVDATLGGGGHTAAILERGGKVIAFDADDVAVHRAQDRFAEQLGTSLVMMHTNFRTMASRLEGYVVHGALFDLGVSSYQFDYHNRGFSFRLEAPLDMRFSATGPTAADLLNSLPEEEIARLIFTYGEDPSARKIAAAIVRRRTLAPYQTTIDLRETITQHIPPQHHNKTLARVFQALRIAVNDELGALETALVDVIPYMVKGAHIVVMSYHSLEDRIVKDTFRDTTQLTVITKKPIEASEQEVERNPRARSARLRVAEVR
ncbi:MAG: 16S rRNA (cytosine(1402)-N(4))-methyltransferase RsmH [Candidatus Kapaibacteriota bacterium]